MTSPFPAYAIGVGRRCCLEIAIERLDNGYVVHVTAPPEPIPEPAAGPSTPDLEGKLDALMEGIPALGRAIAGGNEGEEWKNSEGLVKAKAALKAMFPALERRAFDIGPAPIRQEDLVFGSKEDLLAWLAKNL